MRRTNQHSLAVTVYHSFGHSKHPDQTQGYTWCRENHLGHLLTDFVKISDQRILVISVSNDELSYLSSDFLKSLLKMLIVKIS